MRRPGGERTTPAVFALVTAVAVIVLGLVIGHRLTTDSAAEAQRVGRSQAQTLAETAIAPILGGRDLTAGLGDQQLRRLDELGEGLRSGGEFVQVKLWDSTGRVAWSDSAALIGRYFEIDEDLAVAFAGQPHAAVGRLDPATPEHQGLTLLDQAVDAYQPLFDARHHVIAVAEIYRAYAPLLAAARRQVHGTDEVLAAGLGLLWLVQVALVGWARRRVRRYAGAARAAVEVDTLTGLASRSQFTVQVAALVAAGPVAVAVLDVDGLRRVNDALGTDAGDELLCRLGARLTGALLPGEALARLGGDEFGVAMVGLSEGDVVRRAVSLRSLLAADVDLGAVPVAVDVSIGVALSPQDGTDVARLLQCADTVVRTAKLRPEGVAVHDARCARMNPARLALASQLRQAIETGQLVLHVQPKASLPSGRVHAVEALVRWQHPERGLLPPGEFLEVAESTSLIGPLTAWVLAEALRVAAGWAAAGSPLTISVNLSARTLHDPALADMVADQLAAAGVRPGLLRLEITETAVSSDPAAAVDVLRRLRALGVSLSLDDFGAGFTSLAQLRDLPLTELKVDRTIVAEAATRPADTAVLRALVGLGHDLGLLVVAEGVEDAATQDLLVSLHCDEMQGFHLARPMPTAELLPWLTARRVRQLQLQ